MEALTYIAFLIIDGDEAYAGIIGDVLCSPGDINPRAGFVKQSQSIAGGVAHRFQLLLLTVINYCGGGEKKRQSLFSRNIKYANAAVKLVIPS